MALRVLATCRGRGYLLAQPEPSFYDYFLENLRVRRWRRTFG
jgi:hypothetical protein